MVVEHYICKIFLKIIIKDSIDATLIAIQKSSEIDDHYNILLTFSFLLLVFLATNYSRIKRTLSKCICRIQLIHLFINNNYIFY